MKMYEFISKDIQAKIEQGIYKPDQRLPSLREFSKIYNSTPITVKKSLGILEDSGYIYVVDRVGFFVSKVTDKDYTLIFHETKSIDKLTKVELSDIQKMDIQLLKNIFNLENTDHMNCLKSESLLYSDELLVGIAIYYVIHRSTLTLPVKNKIRLKESFELVLNNYDMEKTLIVEILEQNHPIREKIFVGEDEPVFHFKQIYKTVKGRLAGFSETFIPCEEVHLKMTN